MSQIKIFTSEENLWQHVVSLDSFVTDKNTKTRIALSGGSSAKIITALKNVEFNFKNSELWQADERFIPHSHTDSNVKLMRGLLGEDTSPEIENFSPVAGDPKISAKIYESTLKEDVEGNLFDVTILGVGPDGHTASLFPHSDILDSENLVEATTTDVFAIKDRLTLTFKALKKSKKIIVLMMGSSKKEIFETITNSQTNFKDFPARKLLDWPQVSILFLDA